MLFSVARDTKYLYIWNHWTQIRSFRITNFVVTLEILATTAISTIVSCFLSYFNRRSHRIRTKRFSSFPKGMIFPSYHFANMKVQTFLGAEFGGKSPIRLNKKGLVAYLTFLFHSFRFFPYYSPRTRPRTKLAQSVHPCQESHATSKTYSFSLSLTIFASLFIEQSLSNYTIFSLSTSGDNL